MIFWIIGHFCHFFAKTSTLWIEMNYQDFCLAHSIPGLNEGFQTYVPASLCTGYHEWVNEWIVCLSLQKKKEKTPRHQPHYMANEKKKKYVNIVHKILTDMNVFHQPSLCVLMLMPLTTFLPAGLLKCNRQPLKTLKNMHLFICDEQY